MNPLDRPAASHHDLDDTRDLLDLAKQLPDEDYRRARLPGHDRARLGRRRRVARRRCSTHLVFTKEVWLAAIEGARLPRARTDDDPAGAARAARRRSRRAGSAMVRDIDRRGAWDDRIVDALCDPPESFVLGSVVAHVLTFAAHRRQLARQHAARRRRHAGRRRRPDQLAARRRRTGGRRMTRTIYYTATTLDGFIADEHDSLDWLFVQDQDEDGPLNYEEFIKRHRRDRDGRARRTSGSAPTWPATGETWAYDMPAG